MQMICAIRERGMHFAFKLTHVPQYQCLNLDNGNKASTSYRMILIHNPLESIIALVMQSIINVIPLEDFFKKPTNLLSGYCEDHTFIGTCCS